MQTRDGVGVILLNWNGWKDTVACIESLFECDYEHLNIYICDNHSSDGSLSIIDNFLDRSIDALNEKRTRLGLSKFNYSGIERAACSTVDKQSSGNMIKLIDTGANGGYSYGNNVGIRCAISDGLIFFWLLNNDTEVDRDSLTYLMEKVIADDTIGICGSTLIYFDQRDRIQAYGGASFSRIKGRGTAIGGYSRSDAEISEAEVESQLSFVNGASMLVTKRFIDAVGFLEEKYFLYWEEIDWAVRGARDFKLGFASKSLVYHKVGGTIGTSDSGSSSPLSQYYMAKNRFRFCAKFSKMSLPFVLADTCRAIVRAKAQRRDQEAAALVRATLGLTFRGKV